MTRSAFERIDDIREAIAKCQSYREALNSSDAFLVDMALNAAIRSIEIIGEAVNRLPDDVTDAHPEVDWAQIVGMRNILIHQYFSVDPRIVIDVIDNYLESLARALDDYEANAR